MKGDTDKALWMITKSQADLYAEKLRLEKVGLNLIKNLNYKSNGITCDTGDRIAL